MDYRVYHLSRKEVCRSIALAGLLTVAIAYLFYASWLGIVFFPVFIWFFMKRQKKAGEEQMQLQLAKEFVDTLRSISAALLAGFSIENAWKGRKRNTRIIWEKILYVSGGKGDELFHQPQSTIGAAAGRFLNPKWKYGYCKFFRSFFICKTQRWKFCDNY